MSPLSRTPLTRKTPLKSGSKPLKRSGKLRAVNPERLAKRRKGYAKKFAAYRASETAKVVKKRAAGRCEASLLYRLSSEYVGPELAAVRADLAWMAHGGFVRCVETKKLSDHHVTYARFGGDELPEDVIRVCPRCHSWIESTDHPHRRNGQ